MEIKADKIHKAYGTITVLDDISFSLERGQKAGLIGYNGTGKTTLPKILAELVEPDSGEVTTKKGAVIGYIPQDTSLVLTRPSATTCAGFPAWLIWKGGWRSRKRQWLSTSVGTATRSIIDWT